MCTKTIYLTVYTLLYGKDNLIGCTSIYIEYSLYYTIYCIIE